MAVQPNRNRYLPQYSLLISFLYFSLMMTDIIPQNVTDVLTTSSFMVRINPAVNWTINITETQSVAISFYSLIATDYTIWIGLMDSSNTYTEFKTAVITISPGMLDPYLTQKKLIYLKRNC